MFNRLFLKYYIDNTTLNPGVGGDTIGTDDVSGVKYEVVKVAYGADGALTRVTTGAPLPTTDAVSEAALTSLAAEDFATQTTLALILAKLKGNSATGTITSVSDSASSVTLLASNANRLGATIYNDSTAILYLKLGATASTSSFTVKMNPSAYYEVPFSYIGIIDGIWASAPGGAARVTELT